MLSSALTPSKDLPTHTHTFMHIHACLHTRTHTHTPHTHMHTHARIHIRQGGRSAGDRGGFTHHFFVRASTLPNKISFSLTPKHNFYKTKLWPFCFGGFQNKCSFWGSTCLFGFHMFAKQHLNTITLSFVIIKKPNILLAPVFVVRH